VSVRFRQISHIENEVLSLRNKPLSTYNHGLNCNNNNNNNNNNKAGKYSIDALQKAVLLGTSHIIQKVLQCEN
jgi:hypothetical protein